MNQLFYSKILLFGEYSIMRNSMALAIPYELFSGSLSFGEPQSSVIRASESNSELKNILLYLKHLYNSDKLPVDFDITSFEFDVGQGLFFQSTIPPGYGVGSSGALSAALYDRYVCNRDEFKKNADADKIFILKNHLSILESHFHGSSSGVDPLLSYLSNPILIRAKNEIIEVDLPKSKSKGKGAIFILNTNRARRTEALVNLFMEKLKNPEFARFCDQELRNITDACITSFLEGNYGSLLNDFKKLSTWQYEYLTPMIPKLIQEKWKYGLDSNEFYLKLCGAGGGGFLLGMTHDFNKYKDHFASSEVRVLFRF